MRVLSLDGGGIRGLYQIQVLKIVEKEVGNLNDYFDLIIGTSVGAMLATYIRLGLSTDDMEKQYYKNLFETFNIISNENSIEINESMNIFKVNDEMLKKYTENMYNTLKYKKIKKTYFSVSIDITDQKLEIFKVDENSSTKEIADSILASTAFPSLFKPHEINGKFYSDGGVLYNDPSLLGLIEALKIEKDASKIKILSIGTLSQAIDEEKFFDINYIKRKLINYLSNQNKILKFLSNKSNNVNFFKFITEGSLVSYIHHYAYSFFEATNEGHKRILDSIYSLYDTFDNYLRINHKVVNKTTPLKYLYEYNEMVNNDEELKQNIKKWCNN